MRDLVEALNAHMLPLSPLEFQFKMTVEQMAEANTTVFVARDENGKAVGCGALKMHDNGVGELKRMFTRPEVRGKRVGSLLVDAIVELARARGISRLVLETGTGPGFDGAWRLYENSGFVRCGVVLDYPDSEYSAFFEKRLVEA
ncbi:putative N-acetyltransferase YsnE [compost metagenome]